MEARRFYTRLNTTNEPICIIQGEKGYYPISIDGNHSDTDIDSKMDTLNEFMGNTPEDLEAAIGCSMFGWHIPLAKTIS